MEREIDVQVDSKFFLVLKAAMNLPGVKINREAFLRKELSRYFSAEQVENVIKMNPAKAGITVEQIERMARSCINYETNKVTAISAAAGIPGGFAMAGTIPADIAQYFGHIVRVTQKLIYLYGWKELYNDDGDFDDETTNQLTLFIGVMFGVNAANATVTKLACLASQQVEKNLAKKALTKGIIYPIVKKIAEKIGVKMTKEIFARGVGKVIPVVGGAISGVITYNSFKPMAEKLKNYLKTLPITDVEFYKTEQNCTEVDFSEIIDM